MINLKDNKGLTLIELLAVLVLTVLIFALATPLLINGINRYNDIHKEMLLRDEADLILAKFISEIYTLKESEIKKINWLESSHTDSNYYIEYERQSIDPITPKTETNTYILGFKDNKLFFEGEPYQFANSSIQLSQNQKHSKIEKIGDNNYRVTLELFISKKNKYATFINEIQTINDKGDGS